MQTTSSLGKTELVTNNGANKLKYVYPFYDRNNYFTLKRQIDHDGFRIATMQETVSIVHNAYVVEQETELEGKFAAEIKKMLRTIYTSSRNLIIPNQGIEIFPESLLPQRLISRIGELNQSELEEVLNTLEQNQNLITFVEFGFKTGELDSSEALATHPYTLGFGKDTAEKLVQIAQKQNIKRPWMGVYPNFEKPLITIPGIGSGEIYGARLDIIAYHTGLSLNGHAFAVID